MANTLDILGRQTPVFGGAFSADAALINFAGVDVQGGVGLLTQQLNFNYQQNIQRIFEIGTQYTYYIAGRAMGSASVTRVLGPRPLMFGFYSTYGNVCNAGNNTIGVSMQQGCNSPFDPQAVATFRYMYLVGCVIQSIGFSTQAEQMMFNEVVQMMYVSLIPQQGVL